MIASSSFRKDEPGDVVLVNDVLPERNCCCGVCGEAGRAVWLWRRWEVAELRLLAPIEGVSLAMI
jgi:hypothetical protein